MDIYSKFTNMIYIEHIHRAQTCLCKRLYFYAVIKNLSQMYKQLTDLKNYFIIMIIINLFVDKNLTTFFVSKKQTVWNFYEKSSTNRVKQQLLLLLKKKEKKSFGFLCPSSKKRAPFKFDNCYKIGFNFLALSI